MESAGTIAVIKKGTARELSDASALSNIPEINHWRLPSLANLDKGDRDRFYLNEWVTMRNKVSQV